MEYAEVSKLGTLGLNFHGASARDSSFVMSVGAAALLDGDEQMPKE